MKHVPDCGRVTLEQGQRAASIGYLFEVMHAGRRVPEVVGYDLCDDGMLRVESFEIPIRLDRYGEPARLVRWLPARARFRRVTGSAPQAGATAAWGGTR